MLSATASRNLSYVLILLGVALRLIYFFVDTALWRDEVYIALSVSERSYAELMLPLDYHQSAPIGFLFLEKAIYESAGRSELALRLPALLAAIASVPLFYLLVKKVSPPAVNFALALFIVSPNLIRYGAELKPYAGDVLAAIVVLLCGLTIYEQKTNWRLLAGFAGLGCVFVWFSTPIVFVLFGTGATLIVTEFWRGERKKSFVLVAVSLTWLLSFAVYFFSIAHQALDNEYLVDYWEPMYAPLIPTSGEEVKKLTGILSDAFAHPLSLWPFVLAPLLRIPTHVLLIPAAGLLLAGTIGMLIAGDRCRLVACSFALTLLVTLIVSSCRIYPFATRLILFLVPPALLAISWAATNIRFLKAPPVMILLLVFLLGTELESTLGRLTTTRSRTRELCERLAPQIQPGDAFYVHDVGGRAFHWYSHDLPLDPQLVFYPGELQLLPEAERTEWSTDEMCQHRRVWLILPEMSADPATREGVHQIFLEMQQRCGSPLVIFQEPYYSAYLFVSPEARPGRKPNP